MNAPATLLTLFMLMVAHDAQAAKAPVCVVTQDAMVQAFPKFGPPQEMPKKLLRGFMVGFNASPPHVNNDIDAIIVRQNMELPAMRVMFFKHRCFVDLYDIPIPVFMKFLIGAKGFGI